MKKALYRFMRSESFILLLAAANLIIAGMIAWLVWEGVR